MAIILNVEEQDFIIEVRIGDVIETINMRQALKINDKNLKGEYMEQPSWFAWFSALLADRETRLSETKRLLTRYRAELAMKIRQGKVQIGEVADKAIKLTEGSIQDFIEADEKYQIMTDEVEQTELVCKKLEALVRASVQRKDMLVQLGLLERLDRQQLGLQA